MKRVVRMILLAMAATLAFAGIVNAGKPPSAAPAGQAWADNSDLNGVSLGGSPALMSILTLPDGRFVLNATVNVYNNDFSNETTVLCQLRHGVTGGGTALDFSEVKLPPTSVTGYASAKIALTGVVERFAPAPGVNVHVVCSSTGPAFANYANLNAVSVSSLTIQ